MLSSIPGAHTVPEPDFFWHDQFAGLAKRGLGELPVLQPGERARAYSVLWKLALAGGWPDRRSAHAAKRAVRSLPEPLRRPAWMLLARTVAATRYRYRYVITKSVLATFAAEWIHQRHQPTMILTRRNPLAIVASRMEFRFPDDEEYLAYATDELRSGIEEMVGVPRPGRNASLAARQAWVVGVQCTMTERLARRHPDWLVLDHEWVCEDPAARFREVFARLDLPWSAAVDDFIAARNVAGSGRVNMRLASEEAHRWRTRLTEEQARDASAVLARFDFEYGRTALVGRPQHAKLAEFPAGLAER